MTDQAFLLVTLMTDQNCRHLLEINGVLQLVVSTEAIILSSNIASKLKSSHLLFGYLKLSIDKQSRSSSDAV